MCHPSILAFVERAVTESDARDARVLEVGSYIVNESIRPYIESLKPALYVGLDLRPGPGVDIALPAEEIPTLFWPGKFNVVACCETMEHVEDWRLALTGMIYALAPDGVLVLTTRSVGFPYHEHPGDYWRFTTDDFRRILKAASLKAEIVEDDPEHPGVLVKARKPINWRASPPINWWGHIILTPAAKPAGVS
jgi:hypothetical protein